MLTFSLSARVVSFRFVELNDARLLCRVACAADEAAMRGKPKAELATGKATDYNSVSCDFSEHHCVRGRVLGLFNPLESGTERPGFPLIRWMMHSVKATCYRSAE